MAKIELETEELEFGRVRLECPVEVSSKKIVSGRDVAMGIREALAYSGLVLPEQLYSNFTQLVAVC